MPFGELLERTWNLIRANKHLLWLALYTPLTRITSISSDLLSRQLDSEPLAIGFLLVCPAILLLMALGLYLPILYISATAVVADTSEREGKVPAISSLLQKSHKFVRRLIGLWFYIGLVIGIPVIVLIALSGLFIGDLSDISRNAIVLLCIGLPAFILFGPTFLFADMAAVIEDRRALDALRRGWDVYTTNFWRALSTIFVLMLVAWVFPWILYKLIGLLPGQMIVFSQSFADGSTLDQIAAVCVWIVQTMLSALVGLFTSLAIAVYYFHLAKQMPGQPPAGEPLPESL